MNFRNLGLSPYIYAMGELPNSFLQRLLEVGPGKRSGGLLAVAFFLFDQIDLAVGIWIFLYFLAWPYVGIVLCSFLLTILLHLVVSTTGYLLKMQKTIS